MAFYIEDIQRTPLYKMQFFIVQMKRYTLKSFRNTL